jgi:formylglycine-generating enzyme required for sulfatase activity
MKINVAWTRVALVVAAVLTVTPDTNVAGATDRLPFDGSLDSKPLHNVTLSAFSIGRYPVTYAEFDVVSAALRLPRINREKPGSRLTRR